MKQYKILVAVVFFALSKIGLYGQSVNLLKLRELEATLERGGDVTYVVNFWATWCAPCVRELPYFQEIQNRYGGSDVKVLLVSLDSKNTLETKVRPFVSRSGLTADFFLLDESNQQEYIDKIHPSWSGALPATLIVNTNRGKKKLIEGEVALKDLEDALNEFKE
jgi:thiol-disulfide isomerase/thioredoxin